MDSAESQARIKAAQDATDLVNERIAESIKVLREVRHVVYGSFRNPQMVIDNVGAAKWKLEQVMNTLRPLLHKWPKDEDYHG